MGDNPPDFCNIPNSYVIVKNTKTFIILHFILDTVNAETLKANLNTKQHFTLCTIKKVGLSLYPKDQYHHQKPGLQHCLLYKDKILVMNIFLPNYK